MTTSQQPWWTGERPVSLTHVHKHLPNRPSGEPVPFRSISRWSSTGLGGIRLRAFRVGVHRYTTIEEIVRWQVAVTEQAERAVVA